MKHIDGTLRAIQAERMACVAWLQAQYAVLDLLQIENAWIAQALAADLYNQRHIAGPTDNPAKKESNGK